MKLIGIIKNLSRNMRYRHDKKDEDDIENLVDPNDDIDSNEITMIPRPTRRLRFSCILRYVLLIPTIIYLLIILTPIKHLQSFVPMEIKNTKNFLIVVAHPDDECLFFSPTILGLISRQKTGHILVFSTGNSEGLGPIREKELQGSCQRLGIDSSRCLSLNLTDLQDGSHLWWPKEKISEFVQKHIKQFDIDLIITFDTSGVSGHINHKAVSIGIEYYIKTADKTPLIYELPTTAVIFKFTSILDIFRTIIKFSFRLFRSFFSTILPFLFSTPSSQRALFVSSPLGYYHGLKAFYAHRSQVLWFRHLYTTFSRYMWINDLFKVSND
jgi:N-acetylglucosaminylphosphatidylinositol deacetylase